ncbi:glycosyltransferase family 61 protein [Persicobacter diffluens]|uniref:Glycosyltransferase 61 catalytic domain-containing protein n=1 Tax=Persicobacter diffluens TaxID=981 RepID=A0AAN5AII7_9BACT|nr:hypothetical protein PEDI_10270 [Persicobacter diffluens]
MKLNSQKLKSIARRAINTHELGNFLAPLTSLKAFPIIYSSPKEFKQIIPTYTLNPVVPVATFQYYRQDYKVQHEPVIISNDGLHVVKDGLLFSDNLFENILIKEGKIIQPLSMIHQIGHQANHDPEQYFLPRMESTSHLAGRVFNLLAGGGKNNYFHWMVDALAKTALLIKSGDFETIDWFLVSAHELPFQKQSLALIGIPPSKIKVMKENTFLSFDELWCASSSRHNGWYKPWTQEFFNDIKTPITYSPEKIYISRRDTTQRKVINEDEIIPILEDMGFAILDLGNYTLGEQINLFRNAKSIIAPHGAALTNLFYCKKGTRVLEIFPEEYTSPLYYELCLRKEMNYRMLICPSVNNSHRDGKLSSAKKAHIKINLDEFKKITASFFT